MYLGGMSSSMPEDVQYAMYRTVPGLENVRIVRNAYAIEYDCISAIQLKSSLEFKKIKGLFAGGQFNGSSGYEEAAAQGLVAGINAALKAQKKEKVILSRASSYIGTLIDDLVTKGVTDPYRMMTSRSEYRLILRQDNADERLTPLGYKLGLISEKRFEKFKWKENLKKEEFKRLKNTIIPPNKKLNDIIVPRGTSAIFTGISLYDLLKRPQINYNCLVDLDVERPNLEKDFFEQIETEIKYEGYIKKQNNQINEMKRLEVKKLPLDLEYSNIHGLRLEAIEKLNKVKPENIGQASRISGVSPADISVLLIWLSKNNKIRGNLLCVIT